MTIKAVDLFCGVGGLTYGLQKAGIPVVAGIDIDDSSYIVVINDSSIFNNYGVVLANLNRIEEAKKYFEKALEINPNNEMAKDNLNNLNSYLDIENLNIQK